MIFAYLRVSSKTQKLERQRQALAAYAFKNEISVEDIRIYEDIASGKNFERPEYLKLKDHLRPNDCLLICELDRLGRNMTQIKDEYRELEQKGIDIIVLENEFLSTAGKTDLEKTLMSNIIFALLSYIAEKERQKLKSRQAEGIAIAKSNGVYKGRKRIERPNFGTVYTRWRNKEITAVSAMRELNLSKDTFYRRVKEHEGK